ncbi:peptidase S8/S53 domain-containing protein [Lactarius sanguifluus]|nr:peptidase S8/S53 domain-containing protein [Lactarius sanguifluus]
MCYRWLSVLFVLTIASPTCLAIPLAQLWHDISVKHAWNAVPDNWECLGPPAPGITIDLHVALQPKEENVLREALYEVSTPGHPKYGKHLSKEEVAKLVEPHPDTLRLVHSWLVHSWLAHHGVHPSSISTSHGGGWLTVMNVPVPQANELLGASYQLYRLAGKNDTAILRTVGYALPKNSGGSKEGPTDLNIFMSMFRSDSNPDEVTFTVELVNGGEYDPSWPGFEANIDVQYAQAIAYPTPHIFYSIGGQLMWSHVTNEPIVGDFFLTWVDHLIDQEKIPQTISASYGVNEQLGVLGVSILFASGDNGVGIGNCQDASGRVQFIPKFPATCPYITSVGGTTGSNPEVAAGLSGGGFSNYFERPAYQNVVVPVFLQSLGSQYNGMYNPSGRGIPDVSAQALNFVIVIHSAGARVSGTSCSIPLITSVQTVAGIISLLNDFLISQGKSPLGFLNPWLYSTERGMTGLNDIISGSNPGCGTDGFTAIPGWDPVRHGSWDARLF